MMVKSSQNFRHITWAAPGGGSSPARRRRAWRLPARARAPRAVSLASSSSAAPTRGSRRFCDVGEGEQQLRQRLERDVELEVVALDALLQVGGDADPVGVAPAGRRHVHRERAAALRRIALEALGVDAPAHDLARAVDVLAGRVGQLTVARRLGQLEVVVDARDDLRRHRAGERLAQLRGGIAEQRGDRALLLFLLLLGVDPIGAAARDDEHQRGDDRLWSSHAAGG